MPKISIILPTYNVEKYIARALESCINQTLKDIEIIVVDDRGGDCSIEIAKEYAAKDERIKIIHNKENLKLLHARINGVQNARADYIMFLDPDDELELDACEEAFNAIAQNENIDFACFNFYFYRENKITKTNFKSPRSILSVEEHREYFNEHGWHFWGWNLCMKILKKDLYLKAISQINTNGEKINMAEDALAFYFILLNSNKNIAYIDKYLYKYYINDNSITQQQENQQVISSYEKIFHIINEHDSSIKKRIFSDLYRNYLNYVCITKNNAQKYIQFLYKYQHNFSEYSFNRCLLYIYRQTKTTSIKNFFLYVFYKYKIKYTKPQKLN